MKERSRRRRKKACRTEGAPSVGRLLTFVFLDWADVDVPQSLGEPITKKLSIPTTQQQVQQQPPPPEKEEWDDFEIPAEKLTQKLAQQQLNHQPLVLPHHKSGKFKGIRDKEEEDSWDDLEIPENFQLRLKKK